MVSEPFLIEMNARFLLKGTNYTKKIVCCRIASRTSHTHQPFTIKRLKIALS